MPCLAKIDFGTTSSSTKTTYNPKWARKLNYSGPLRPLDGSFER